MEDGQKIGMTRDEWNYYCELCKTGDAEAVREYMRKFEKQEEEDVDGYRTGYR